jgi:hypothetical protein
MPVIFCGASKYDATTFGGPCIQSMQLPDQACPCVHSKEGTTRPLPPDDNKQQKHEQEGPRSYTHEVLLRGPGSQNIAGCQLPRTVTDAESTMDDRDQQRSMSLVPYVPAESREVVL